MFIYLQLNIYDLFVDKSNDWIEIVEEFATSPIGTDGTTNNFSSMYSNGLSECLYNSRENTDEDQAINDLSLPLYAHLDVDSSKTVVLGHLELFSSNNLQDF